jgi:hypothetical protein
VQLSQGRSASFLLLDLVLDVRYASVSSNPKNVPNHVCISNAPRLFTRSDVSIFAAFFQPSMVLALGINFECPLSGDESESAELRFGSDCDIRDGLRSTDLVRSTRTPVLLCQNFSTPFLTLEKYIEQSWID